MADKKLYEIINKDNWDKSYQFGDARSLRPTCLFGHLVRLGWEFESQEALFKAVVLLYPDRLGDEDRWGQAGIIGFFNDHPETTVEDVLRVCKVADV